MEFIENYDNFLLASGELPDSYYQQDKLHLNKYGTKKLLSNIDNVHRVSAQVQPSGSNKPTYMYRMPSHQMHHRRPGSQNRPDSNKIWSPTYCHICMRKYGTKKLLSNIDNVHRVSAQVQPSGSNKPTYMYRMPSHQMHHRRPGSQNRPDSNKIWSPTYCHICMRNGHATQECWFNGRADGWSGRQMR